tara:strand:- start:3374 stop:3595 length:222 start_codon:yes stop_codon:yes gene_type:complete
MSTEKITVELTRNQVYALMKVETADRKHWEDMVAAGLGQYYGMLKTRSIRWRWGSLDRLPLIEVWGWYERVYG